MSDKPQAPVRVVRHIPPIDVTQYDGMKCPYTGDVFRVYNGRLEAEKDIPTPALPPQVSE